MGEEIDPQEIFEKLMQEKVGTLSSRRQLERAAEEFVKQIYLGVWEVMQERDFLIEKMKGWWIFRRPVLVRAEIAMDGEHEFSIHLGPNKWISVEIVKGISVDVCVYEELGNDKSKSISIGQPRTVSAGIEMVLKELIKCSQL